MADQHDYDGIRYREEKSSPLIFRILFWGLVIWAVPFMGYYIFSGWSSDAEFLQKKKAREEQVAKGGGQAAAPLHKEGKKEDYIAMGKKDYAEKCASCHGIDAKGGIGSDLTSKEFKFGKTVPALTESIAKGRPGGMPAFGTLSHEQLEGLVQYILSL